MQQRHAPVDPTCVGGRAVSHGVVAVAGRRSSTCRRPRARHLCAACSGYIYMGRRWAMAIVRPRRRRGPEEEEEPHYYSTLINCQNWHPWRGDVDGDHARRAATYAMEALLCPVRAGSSSIMQCAYTSKERGSQSVWGKSRPFKLFLTDWLMMRSMLLVKRITKITKQLAYQYSMYI
jgi:hypothetical protein